MSDMIVNELPPNIDCETVGILKALNRAGRVLSELKVEVSKIPNSRVMSQSTSNQVPITTQRKFHLYLPSPKEQQKIADSLTSMDQSIIKLKKQIEQTAQFKKWLL